MLQSVLIFLGQLKDESVGEKRHGNLPGIGGVEMCVDVAERSVDLELIQKFQEYMSHDLSVDHSPHGIKCSLKNIK